VLEVYGYNRGGLLVHTDDIQGFVPVSHLVELPATLGDEERIQTLCSYVGRTLCLKVIECNPALERVVFSERAAQAGEGCRRELFRSLQPGKVISGKVTNVTDFGVFIDLGGVEGLVHVSELSWGRVSHPGEILKVGQNVQTVVLQVSEENSRVALSLKRLSKNPWDEVFKRYRPGDVVEAEITSIVRFGVFARMEEGIEGLIHISSIELPEQKANISSFLSPGQKVQVKILHIDIERRRLGLDLVNLA
jgi:small subunit ribosomal protein S1